MEKIGFTYSRERFFPGYDGKFCKVCPNVAYDGDKTAFLTYQMLLLSGSDVFYNTYIAESSDGGKTFSEPKLMKNQRWYENGIRMEPSGWLLYNKKHKKWFGLGHVVKYENDEHPMIRNGFSLVEPVQFFFDLKTADWDRIMALPFLPDADTALPGHQIIEYENGDILVSFYYSTGKMTKTGIITVRYAFGEDDLSIVEIGEPISGENYGARGLAEPSLAYLNGKYYLTIRSDEQGLFAVSDDGFHFSEPQPWKWDDGSVLENYNTMQHFIRSRDGIFLAYTRKGAHNDHVFRHRAPIFMAHFDEERLCLVRSSEVILVPELGARLGNFNVIEATEKESWLITAEWMQPAGCEKYGSDNSLWIAKIRWEQ